MTRSDSTAGRGSTGLVLGSARRVLAMGLSLVAVLSVLVVVAAPAGAVEVPANGTALCNINVAAVAPMNGVDTWSMYVACQTGIDTLPTLDAPLLVSWDTRNGTVVYHSVFPTEYSEVIEDGPFRFSVVRFNIQTPTDNHRWVAGIPTFRLFWDGAPAGVTVTAPVLYSPDPPAYPTDFYPGGSQVGVPSVFDIPVQVGRCDRAIDIIDGVHWVTANLDADGPFNPTDPSPPGVHYHDYPVLDRPWTTPTFDDDRWTYRFPLPPAAEQPAGGWVLTFQFVRWGDPGHGFIPPIPSTGLTTRPDGSQLLALSCVLKVDLADLEDGATGVVGPFTPDTEQTPESMAAKLAACRPTGWAILNPSAFVEGLGCVLRVLFVPTTLNPFAVIRAEASLRITGGVTDGLGTIQATFAALSQGANGQGQPCGGPGFSIPIGGGRTFEFNPWSLCNAGTEGMVGMVRNLSLVGLYLGFAWKCTGYFLNIVGINAIWKEADEHNEAMDAMYAEKDKH